MDTSCDPTRRITAGRRVVGLVLMLVVAAGCNDDDRAPMARPADLDFSGVWLNTTGTPVYNLSQAGGAVTGTANVTIGTGSDHFLVSGWVREKGMVLTLQLPPGIEHYCSGCNLPETHCLATLFDAELHALAATCLQDAHRCCGTHFEVERELHREHPITYTPSAWIPSTGPEF